MRFASFAAARVGRVAGLLASSFLLGCAPLPDLIQTGCGDRVLAIGEDCDGAGKSEDGTTFECIPRDAAGACHFRPNDGVCPAGFRAGLDDVCRLPSGTFESGAILAIAATHAVAVDYDGDGRKDLFLQGENGDEPILFDGRTPIALGFSFSPYEFGTQGAAGDLTGDGLTDVLEPLGASLLTFEGASFGLRTYASDDPGGVFRVVPVDAPALAHFDPSAALHPDLDAFARLIGCPATGLVQPLCAATGAASVLYVVPEYGVPTALLNGGIERDLSDVGSIVRAKLSTTRDCRDVVLLSIGYPEADVVPVCGVCDPDTLQCTVDPKVTVSLADPLEPSCPEIQPLAAFSARIAPSTTDTVLVEGVCGDGHHVLYSLDAGPTGVVAAYYADVPSGFGRPLGPSDALVSDIADIDADGNVDLVSQNLIYLSAGAPLSATTGALYGGDWVLSKIADVNADGWLDVLGARYSNSVDVLLGGPFTAFAPGLVPTTGQVHALAVGDFDGDGTPDLFTAEGGEACGANDLLSVAFGRFHGFPEVPTPIGETPWAAQVVAARTYRPSGLDSIADLALVSECDATSLHAAALFTGSSSRLMSSPYELRLPASGGVDPVFFDPRAFAVADVAGSAGPGADGLPDLVALGSDGLDTTLMTVPGTSGAGLTPSGALQSNHLVRLGGFDPFSSRPSIAFGDVRGDAGLEVLIGGVHYGQEGAVGDLFVVSASDFQSGAVATVNPFGSSSPSMFGGTTTVGVADVDADGDLDALALFSAPTDGIGEGATKEEIFPVSELIVAERAGDELLPICRIAAPPATTLTDLSTADVGGVARALIVSSSRGLLRYEASAGAPCGGTFVALADTSAGTDAVAYAASGIVVADFDGDGLDDIGVLGSDGTSFVHQRATSLGDAQ